MVHDRAIGILTMADQYEVVCGLLKGVIISDTELPLT